MDRVFAYEDAKKLCATHKQILNTIKKIIASRGKDASRVQKAAQEVYDSIGRKVKGIRNEIRRIDIDMFNRDFIHYYMDIAVDQNGYIVDVSRLEAIMLPDPHAPYETGRLYPVTDLDYSTTVDVIFEDDIRFED